MNKKEKDQKELLTELVLENKEKFYRLAYSYVKNENDALDIIQESIHKALKGIHTLENPQALKSWFYRIVVTTSLDLLRKKKKEMIVDDDTLEFFIPKRNDTYENVDLTRLLNDLPPKYRTVIILKFFEDLKIREIAEILNEKENTIKTRLYKGLKLMRLEMSDNSYLGGY
ncbi:RNA polymerase sigma factor [Neobacillus massiliamazoniensis]|uniref:ECF family DNA-directed RNA polymerase sigma subunit SigV n=1 Tax=Neobacillus massiliamazoniensis TaxID=1499688 RepID=A0A0U1NT74_9BACI|nr:RNA polymerase sigma factor [Neobacillus massiliamazoniensis]CRK81237.1 ECF family DNA-directed RNA polymerase sigma subunit SigV [Neobacillus massiliamazoniensis]